jgi:hypothetical protein
MDVEVNPLLKTEVHQTSNLFLTGEVVLPVALKENQLDFIKKRGELCHVRDQMIRKDLRGRGQLKRKEPFIAFRQLLSHS